jgi:PAS domain S-box-containing protein
MAPQGSERINGMRLEQLVLQMPDAVVIADADSGRIVVTNRQQQIDERAGAASTLSELAESFEIFHPDGRPYMADEWQLARSLDAGETITGEEFFRLAEDGSRVTFRGSSAPVRDDDGRIVGAVSVTQDVSEEKRVEQRLRYFAQVVDNTDDAVVGLDADWYVTDWNPGAERLYGWTADEVVGRHTTDVAKLEMSDEERSEVRRETLERGRYRGEVEAYRKDGSTVLVDFSTLAVKNDAGDVVGYLGIHRGLNVRIRRANQVAERRARQQAAVAELGLRALAQGELQPLMDDAVAAVAHTLGVDMVGIGEILPGGGELLLRAGHGWHEGAVGKLGPAGTGSLVGYTVAKGEPVVSEDFATDDRFSISSVLASNGGASGACVVIQGHDGPFGSLGAFCRQRHRFSEDDVNFLQSVANVIGTAVERSVSERKLRDVREAERSRIARELHDEALRELTDAQAEAYRAQTLSADPATVDRLARLVPTLARAGQQLRAAIYDLRLDGEQNRPFGDLLESLVALHRARASGSEVVLDVRDGVPKGPLGPRGSGLLRIVGEALANARRHSGARRISVGAWGSRDRVSVEVRDDGRGFDVDSETASTDGLGIKGMRERAAALGAELQIRSEPGEGTKVRVELGLAASGEPVADHVRVLLVEDHVAVREAIAAAFLRDGGFDVVGQAGSLSEARGMLSGVDVAVIDLGLPDGYGGDLIGELREAEPEAQALVLSANLDRTEIARAVDSGAAGALSKAAPLEQLVQAVQRLRAGETLLPLEEVVELLRFAARRRAEEYEDRAALQSLTPRELEVLQALADGLDSRGVAESLHISIRTERNHVASILTKLDVHSQLQALVFALRYEVVEIR